MPRFVFNPCPQANTHSHAAYSRHCLGLAAGAGPDQSREWRARADVEAQISQHYRSAWLYPWRLYTLVD